MPRYRPSHFPLHWRRRRLGIGIGIETGIGIGIYWVTFASDNCQIGQVAFANK